MARDSELRFSTYYLGVDLTMHAKTNHLTTAPATKEQLIALFELIAQSIIHRGLKVVRIACVRITIDYC